MQIITDYFKVYLIYYKIKHLYCIINECLL